MLLHEPSPITYLNGAALLTTVFAAAWTDWKSWRIPNRLVVASSVAALMIGVFSTFGTGMIHTLIGGMVGMALLLPLYLLRGMAAGDVKLAGAIGLHAGAVAITQIIFISALIAGIWSIAKLVARTETARYCGVWLRSAIRLPAATGVGEGRMTEPLLRPSSRGTIPYGVVIAIASTTICVLGWIRPSST